MSAIKVRHTLIKLRLLELGNISEYLSFEDLITVPVVFEDYEVTHASDLEKKLLQYEEQYKQYVTNNNKNITKNNLNNADNTRNSNNNKKINKQNDISIKNMQRLCIEIFFKTAIHTKKCENCGGNSNTFRKDGYSKIFQKPLAKRMQKQMRAMKKKIQVCVFQRIFISIFISIYPIILYL